MYFVQLPPKGWPPNTQMDIILRSPPLSSSPQSSYCTKKHWPIFFEIGEWIVFHNPSRIFGAFHLT
jgi:hypothetical protein